MKNFLAVLIAVLFLSACAPAEKSTPPAANNSAPGANSAPAQNEVKRGAALTNAPATELATIVKEPEKFAGKAVTVEGEVQRVCQNKGCWMELKSGDAHVRVTFKDYGFFVPTDSKGMKVKAEGQVEVKKMDKETVDHLTGEGANIKRNADGTANEVTFVASGVELRK